MCGLGEAANITLFIYARNVTGSVFVTTTDNILMAIIVGLHLINNYEMLLKWHLIT